MLEVSGPPESGSDHVQDDQTASQGRSPKPTASLVAAIELEEEIGLRFRSSSDHVATDIDDRSDYTNFGPRKE